MSETVVADLVHHGDAGRWGGWSWRKPDRGEHFRRCSYCGSISPDDLAAEPAGTGCAFTACPSPRDELAAIHFPVEGRPGQSAADGFHLFADTGWRASWADRKYGWPHKFYVEGLANRTPGSLYVIGSTNADESPGAGWTAVGEMTREQRKVIKADPGAIWGNVTWIQFGHHSAHFAKFYTTHLADPALDPEVKAAIERVSGIQFTFDGTHVSWGAAGTVSPSA